MSALISFFLTGAAAPARLQVLLIAFAIAAAGVLGLLTWGLYWRGEYRDAKVELVTLQAQGAILASAVEACSTSVELARVAGETAIAQGVELLEAARGLHKAGLQLAGKSDAIARGPARPGQDCRDAWREIESAIAAGVVP